MDRATIKATIRLEHHLHLVTAGIGSCFTVTSNRINGNKMNSIRLFD